MVHIFLRFFYQRFLLQTLLVCHAWKPVAYRFGWPKFYNMVVKAILRIKRSLKILYLCHTWALKLVKPKKALIFQCISYRILTYAELIACSIFILILSLSFFLIIAALLVENGKFLLSAKRTRRTTYTEYVISMDADNISRSSSTYIGKLRLVRYIQVFNIRLFDL